MKYKMNKKLVWKRSKNSINDETIIEYTDGCGYMRLFILKNGELYSDEQIDEIIEIYKMAFNTGFNKGKNKKIIEIKKALEFDNIN